MSLTIGQIANIACEYGIEYAALRAFMEVESGGIGFAKDTGKIIIQFEPSWFKKKAPYAPSGKWSVNGVEKQSAEWIAFNDAFAKNKTAAMESTSIGLGQIMGFHYSRLGYKTVGDMWNDAKVSEVNQLRQLVKFIATDSVLYKAIKAKDFHTVAVRYNGAGYQELAKKLGREPYNISMSKAYNKFS